MNEPSFWTGEFSLERLPALTPDEERAAAPYLIKARAAKDKRDEQPPEWREVEEFLLAEEIAERLAEKERQKAA